jgi:hypothetical protein
MLPSPLFSIGAREVTREHYLICHIRRLATETLQYFPNALLLEEKRLLETVTQLADDVGDAALVFARLLQRKKQWTWSDSLFKGVDRGTDVEVKKKVLEALFSRGILDALHPKSGFEAAWSATAECFTAENLNSLLQRLRLSKNGDMATKLNSLYGSLMTVRTMRGYLRDELAEHVVKCARESKGQGLDPSHPIIVRIKPHILHLFRRALRLLQVRHYIFSNSIVILRVIKFHY